MTLAIYRRPCYATWELVYRGEYIVSVPYRDVSSRPDVLTRIWSCIVAKRALREIYLATKETK